MLRAGVILRKEQLLSAYHVDKQNAAGEGAGGLHGIRQPRADFLLDHQAVDHHLNVVLFIFIKLDRFREIINAAIHTHTHIAGFARRIQLLTMLTLSPADHRREHLNLRTLVERHDPIDDLIDCLLLNLLAANRAMRDADAGIQQAQIVVDFRNGTDRGAWVLGGGFLIDRNRRGKAINRIHIRLLHLA